MEYDPDLRLGFLVNEVGRLYSQQFDRLAREKLGLTQAQCRLLAVLARQAREARGQPLSQAELAARMQLSAMGVAKLCDRMAAAGWIERRPSAGDRRVNELHMLPPAKKALQRALSLADDLTERTLAGLDGPARKQLFDLLRAARRNLAGLPLDAATAPAVASGDADSAISAGAPAADEQP